MIHRSCFDALMLTCFFTIFLLSCLSAFIKWIITCCFKTKQLLWALCIWGYLFKKFLLSFPENILWFILLNWWRNINEISNKSIFSIVWSVTTSQNIFGIGGTSLQHWPRHSVFQNITANVYQLAEDLCTSRTPCIVIIFSIIKINLTKISL